MDETQQIRAHRESLRLNGFQILFAAVGLLQTMMKQGSEGVGVGEGKMKIISLFVSISLFAFAAAVVLPLRYTDILCRISFFFLVLACSSLLSPFVPHLLFWFPYLACVLPLLHLLQLTPTTLQASVQQLCRSSWTAIHDFACGAHQRLIRTTTSIKTTLKDDSELSTITASSPPPCGGSEEGCVLKGKCSWERGSFKRSREQFVSGSTLCSTGSIIIYAKNPCLRIQVCDLSKRYKELRCRKAGWISATWKIFKATFNWEIYSWMDARLRTLVTSRRF